MSAVTVVMYHYVRDLARTRYPGLKALSVEAFEGQLDYITRHYTVCRPRDVIAAARGEGPLPPRPCLLTFDDGFLDHFTVVFPRLVDRGLGAGFYPPVAVVEGRRVLDTHKVQLVLAVAPEAEKLARRILDMLDGFRDEHRLPSGEEIYRTHARASRFDGPDVVFVKRVLQHALPPAVRSSIAARLFEEYVGVEESTVARELYMDEAQLRCLIAAGLEVGGHGAKHLWLDSLPRVEQAREIERTVHFLERLHGRRPRDWVMCYPFGSYDDVTLDLLREAGCALGLTTRVALAHDLTTPLTLPRLDTNDLPTRGDAPPNAWTAEAAGGRDG